jgi:hypothetical protein
MVKRPTIILLAILAALALFTWWFEFSPSSAARKATPESTGIPAPFANWKFENTRLIEYTSPDGTQITIRMGKDFNTWSIDQLKDTPVDSGKVFQLMTELFSIKPLKKLESTSDESAMGLGEKARKLKLSDLKGQTIDIQLGAETATKSGTYIKVGSDYYIINTPVINNLNPLLTNEGLLSTTDVPSLSVSTLQP